MKTLITFVLMVFSSVCSSQEIKEGWYRQQIPTTESLRSIGIVSRDTVFVSSVSKVFRTTNGGETWLPFNINGDSGIIKFLNDGKHGWMMSGKYTNRTTDGGRTWDSLPPPNIGALQFRDYDFANENLGSLLTFSDNRMWRTTDGGKHWEQTGYLGNLNGPNDIAFADTLNGFVVGKVTGITSGFARTTDGGKTWFELSSNTPFGKEESFPSIYPVSKDTLFVCGRGIYVSHNGGKNWSTLLTPTPTTRFLRVVIETFV